MRAINISVSKIINKLTELITSTSKEQSGFKLPGIFMGNESETDPAVSLGVLALNIAVSAANLTQTARTIYCVGQLITNPMMLLDTVGLMAAGASSIMLDMADRMVKLVKNQLTQALSQINGAFTSLGKGISEYIDELRNFVKSIESLCTAIGNFIDNLDVSAQIEYDEFCSKEDCEFMFAMMAACLLSKLIGNKLQEFEQKITTKINNKGAELNDALAESISEVGNITGYLEREKFMMEKASKQLDGLHRLISDKGTKKTYGPLKMESSTEEAKSNTSQQQEKAKAKEEVPEEDKSLIRLSEKYPDEFGENRK